MSRESIFKEIKGNCSDLTMTSRYDHCMYHGDDCEMPCCPRMKKFKGIIREEAHREREEAQCPTCGSIVAPHEIDKTHPTLIQGTLYGIVGSVATVIGLWALCSFIYMPAEVKLYILNYMI